MKVSYIGLFTLALAILCSSCAGVNSQVGRRTMDVFRGDAPDPQTLLNSPVPENVREFAKAVVLAREATAGKHIDEDKLLKAVNQAARGGDLPVRVFASYKSKDGKKFRIGGRYFKYVNTAGNEFVRDYSGNKVLHNWWSNCAEYFPIIRAAWRSGLISSKDVAMAISRYGKFHKPYNSADYLINDRRFYAHIPMGGHNYGVFWEVAKTFRIEPFGHKLDKPKAEVSPQDDVRLEDLNGEPFRSKEGIWLVFHRMGSRVIIPGSVLSML